MQLRTVSLTLSLCLVACAGAPVPDAVPSPPRVVAGEPFTLTVGDSVWVGETDLMVIFAGIAEDSRCARNVTCVWEGNARASFTVREFSPFTKNSLEVLDDNFELNTSGRFAQRRSTSVGDLVLKGLDPQPPIEDPKKYVAVLVIEPKK